MDHHKNSLAIKTTNTKQNNTGDSNGMHTSNLGHNYMKDDMIGMNQNANNILSGTKGDNTITTETMSNMKGM